MTYEEERCSICSHQNYFHYGKNGQFCDACGNKCLSPVGETETAE